MSRLYLLAPFGVLTALAGCGAEPQKNSASTAPAAQSGVAAAEATTTAQATAATKATLTAQSVPDFADISVPTISGINNAAAQRINATLATLRNRAVAGAKQCRTSAGSNPFSYRYAAQPTFNDRGVLSLRITGAAACGGTRDDTIVEAHTFDLATGAEVNVTEASGTSAAKLAALAVQGYRGDAGCKTFLAGDGASLGSAFVTDRGIGVNYTVDVGAAESCAAEPGVVPWAALAGGLKPPLATLAQPAR